MKRTKVVLIIIGILMVITLVLVSVGLIEVAATVICVAVGLFIFVFPILLIADLAKRAGDKRKAREAIKATPEYKEQQEKQRRIEEERTTIVEVKLIGGGSVKEHKYGMKGAAVGGLIAGVPGAIVGAAMPNGKQTQKQKFAVKYKDGHVEIKEYTPGSAGYNNLIAYLKWEDIE